MKVAVFETEHFESTYSLVKLLDNDSNEITIFAYPSVSRQLELMLKDSRARYRWVIKKEKQSKLSFIRTIYREVKKQQIGQLYLNTVADNHIFYVLMLSFLPRLQAIVTVHAVNSFFDTGKKYLPRRMIRSLGKRLLVKRVKEFNVLSSTLVPALAARLPSGKKIHVIPGGIFEEGVNPSSVPVQKDRFFITIPGSIDNRRRDYRQVFELMGLLQQKSLRVTVIFAGSFYGVYGQLILQQCREWKQGMVTLQWQESGVIDQPEFDRLLSKADFIFSPSAIRTVIEDDIEEIYGATICSGNLADSVRHARPLIVPQILTIDPQLEKSSIRYTTVNELALLLEQFFSEPVRYEELSRSALETSKQFSIEKIRKENELFHS